MVFLCENEPGTDIKAIIPVTFTGGYGILTTCL